MYAYVRTYVYEEGKGKSKSYIYFVLVCQLDWLCPINQVQIDCMYFSVLSITQDERRERNKNFIPLECLIHVSPHASHVRELMNVLWSD